MRTPKEILEIQKYTGKIAEFLMDNNKMELANSLYQLNRLVDEYYKIVSEKYITQLCEKGA